MRIAKVVKNPYTSLVINFIYALGNCVVGFLTYSWWFITVGAYYAILTVTRYSVLQIRRKANGDYNTEIFARRTTGILFIALSFCIVGMNILSAIKERGTAFHEIIMIAIAAYTFSKTTIAIISMVKAKRSVSPVSKTLRDISLADACVSICTMQRSMLVSFPGMNPKEVQLLNILTGTAVWITVLFLGINLMGGKRINMAKSKIVKVIDKTAEAVTGSYKKIEKSVVGSYTNLEDKFVNAYLTKDGETVEEAKARLKKENKS